MKHPEPDLMRVVGEKPGFFSHSTRVPASMSAPSDGILNRPIGLSSHDPADGGDDPLGAGQRRLLEVSTAGGHSRTG